VDEDLGRGLIAHSQGNGIRWPAVEVDWNTKVALNKQVRSEDGASRLVADLYPGGTPAEGIDCLLQRVMGHRPLRSDPPCTHGDRPCFLAADEDLELTRAALFPQQHPEVLELVGLVHDDALKDNGYQRIGQGTLLLSPAQEMVCRAVTYDSPVRAARSRTRRLKSLSAVIILRGPSRAPATLHRAGR
jgi:hypothetical protein